MMVFKHIHAYQPNGGEGSRQLLVLEDDVGWLYIKRLVEQEGLATPFSSIEELQLCVQDQLVKQWSADLDNDGRIVQESVRWVT